MIEITGDQLKLLLEDPTFLVDFAGREDERHYEQRDRELYSIVAQILSSRCADAEVYQSDDWWPNHLRGVELSQGAYSDELVRDLQAILKGRFKDYRIILHVYTDLKMGSAHLFSVLITETRAYLSRDNIGS